MSTYHTALIVLGTAFTVAVACVVRYRYLQSALLIRKFTVAVASMLRNLQNTLLSGEKPPVVKAIEHPGRTAAIREAMGKQLQFLQDIPQDQRTQRHSMQIEYYLLAEKCAEIAYMSHQAIVQEEPLHVAIAKLGDPAVFHAMLARMYFMAQSPPYGYAYGNRIALISTLGPWATIVKQGDMFSGSILPPEEALRSEPGILSGEARAVLKAVAFRLILGADSFNHELLSLTLLRSAIAGLETNEGSRLALTSFLRELQPDFSADDFLWVLYIMYSQNAVVCSMTKIRPWGGEVPEVMVYAQRCAAKACELRPQLPYGFENAASMFQLSRMHGSSYMYADKGLQLARDLKDDYCVYSMAICKACALIFGGRLPYTLGEVKALRIEAVEASKRTKKYLSKIIRTLPQQHILDTALENIPVGVRDNTRIIKALNHFPPNTQQNAHGTSSATASSVELKFMCSNCGLGGDYMKKCSGCASVSYCCKKCQVQHWKAGHKSNCKK